MSFTEKDLGSFPSIGGRVQGKLGLDPACPGMASALTTHLGWEPTLSATGITGVLGVPQHFSQTTHAWEQ